MDEYIIQQLVCIVCVLLGVTLGGIISFFMNKDLKIKK